MVQIANQNVAPSSAPAENRVLPQPIATALRHTVKTPPSDIKDPDNSNVTPELDLLLGMLGMGPPQVIVDLAPPSAQPEANFPDGQSSSLSEFSDYAFSEVSDSDMIAPYPPRCLWDQESLQAFTSVCVDTAIDTVFDKLNNVRTKEEKMGYPC